MEYTNKDLQKFALGELVKRRPKLVGWAVVDGTRLKIFYTVEGNRGSMIVDLPTGESTTTGEAAP